MSPQLNRLFVPLDRTSNRDLRRPPQGAKHPGNVVFVVADAQFFMQDLGDASARPELSLETVGFRPMPKKIGNQRFLSIRQLGLPAMRMRHQSLHAASGKMGKPLTDRLLGNSQGIGNIPVNPTQTRQLHGPKTPPLTPIVKTGRFHSAIVSPKNLSGLRSCQ